MKPSKALALTLAALTLGGGFSAHASEIVGDANAGAEIVKQCATCHGRDGVAKIPIAPHIGGEPAAYLAAQLRAFRSGAREHEMMNVVAKTLDDQRIADISAYYAALIPEATPAKARPGRNAPEDCTGCHGEDGLSVVEDAPNLAGENVIYIMTQLKAFRTGQREHEVMSEIAKSFSDPALFEAAEWYDAIKFATREAN